MGIMTNMESLLMRAGWTRRFTEAGEMLWRNQFSEDLAEREPHTLEQAFAKLKLDVLDRPAEAILLIDAIKRTIPERSQERFVHGAQAANTMFCSGIVSGLNFRRMLILEAAKVLGPLNMADLQSDT